MSDSVWTPPPGFQGPSSTPVYGTNRVNAATFDGAAVVALILAIASFFFWIVPAIIAIPLASGARRRIVASKGQLKGRELATAAQIVAVVSLAIAALAIALLFIA